MLSSRSFEMSPGTMVIGIGNVSLKVTPSFELSGIAFGTIVAVGLYHLAKALAPKALRDSVEGANLIIDGPGVYDESDDIPPAR